jgi:ribonuclease BN (tRNA processing enzyme)
VAVAPDPGDTPDRPEEVRPANTLTVLGCDGSYPGPGGAGSGYLVRSGSTTLWLDAGPGTFANLQQFADPATVDAVVLSHEHPDHWTDLESFAVWRRQSGATAPVPVYAPPGLRRRSYFAEDPLLGWQEIGPSHRLAVGQLTCSFVATDHGPPTLAVRVDPLPAGHALPPSLSSSLAYSADSGPDWTVEELGRGIGTVLCEATFTRRNEGASRHMSGYQAARMAAAAGADRLLLTHRWPTVSAGEVAGEAADAFGGPVQQAAVGRVFEW